MKRLVYLVVACLLATTLVGCFGEGQKSIIGKWRFSYTKDAIYYFPNQEPISLKETGGDLSGFNEMFDGVVFEFKADGKLITSQNGQAGFSDTYSVSGNILHWGGSQSGVWTFERSGNTLELKVRMPLTIQGTNLEADIIWIFNKI